MTVRPHLREVGAEIGEPLARLRQGEQYAWLSDELARRRQRSGSVHVSQPVTQEWAAQQHATSVRVAREQVSSERRHTNVSRPAADRTAHREAVAAALVDYRQRTDMPRESRLGFAHSPDADALLRTDPFAFLIGVILDEGIQAERAWEGPLLLQQRLGHLDPWRLRGEHRHIREAVGQQPMLHRYVNRMADAIVRAAEGVCTRYDGDASRIWAPGSSAAEVEQRFRAFYKIGVKKAAMAVELLVSHFGIELADLTGTNVAYDIHVRRVFLRTGLADVDDVDVIMQTARELSPDRPGLLDQPAWMIGRKHCHASNPDCAACPLTQVCSKLMYRQV